MYVSEKHGSDAESARDAGSDWWRLLYRPSHHYSASVHSLVPSRHVSYMTNADGLSSPSPSVDHVLISVKEDGADGLDEQKATEMLPNHAERKKSKMIKNRKNKDDAQPYGGAPAGITTKATITSNDVRVSIRIHPSLSKTRTLLGFWRGTMIRRILWKILLLEAWAAVLRFVLYELGMRDGILDGSVSQLITVIMFVLGIIIGNSIGMGMNMFMKPVEAFHSELLGSICVIAMKAASHLRIVMDEYYCEVLRRTDMDVDADGDGDQGFVPLPPASFPHASSGISKQQAKESLVGASQKCIWYLETVKYTCAMLPVALYEKFAPASSACVMRGSDWIRYVPSLEDYVSIQLDNVKHASSTDGGYSALRRKEPRNWMTELDDLRIISMGIESFCHELGSWRTTVSLCDEINGMYLKVKSIDASLSTTLPEPYLNLIFLFVYGYLVVFPLFFSLSNWWLDALVYFLVSYIMLSTYELSERLRKEKGFDNEHTYIPFVEWCNDTIVEVGHQIDIATEAVRFMATKVDHI